MIRTVATVLYWLAAVTIALGAYGHGFVGVVPVRDAIAASPLAPDVVRVIWIVWYFVSGCMLVFGALLAWAWPAVESGAARGSTVSLIIGAFYACTGVAAYAYSKHDPFWLVFLVQGVMLIGATLVLRTVRR